MVKNEDVIKLEVESNLCDSKDSAFIQIKLTNISDTTNLYLNVEELNRILLYKNDTLRMTNDVGSLNIKLKLLRPKEEYIVKLSKEDVISKSISIPLNYTLCNFKFFVHYLVLDDEMINRFVLKNMVLSDELWASAYAIRYSSKTLVVQYSK
jgi:hypothetical protein